MLTLGIVQVPVIAVFTKYNQFKRDIEMDQDDDAQAQLHVQIDSVFSAKYLAILKGTPPYICLESEVSVIVETLTELTSRAQKSTKPAQSAMLSSN